MKKCAKFSFMLACMLTVNMSASAVNANDVLKAKQTVSDTQKADSAEVLDMAEQMPAFPGGASALLKWLGNNVKYPAAAEAKGIQGRVLCQFTVETDGSLSGFKIIKSVDPLLDEEALRVLSIMPKWTPGKQGGKPVRVKFTLPVSFKLGTPAPKQGATPIAAPNQSGATKSNGEKVVTKKLNSDTPKVDKNSEVFDVVEQMPSFAGDTAMVTVMTESGPKQEQRIYSKGPSGLRKWLADNMKYPAIAEENGIQGRVVCQFVVEKDGSISDVQVLQSVDPSLDKEAVRVVKAMPKWTPGKQGGAPVRVKYTVPLQFRLQ